MFLDSSLNITLDSNHDAVFYVSGEEKLRLNNLGIDVTDKLLFDSTTYIDSSVQDDASVDELRFLHGDTQTFRIFGDKRLGIGYVSYPRIYPNAMSYGLDLHTADTNTGIKFTNDNQTNGATIRHTGSEMEINNAAGGGIIFKQFGIESMRIASNGAIGINESDPDYCLHMGFINSNSGGATYSGGLLYFGVDSGGLKSTTGMGNLSMFVNGAFVTASSQVTPSDRRIKTNIQKKNSSECLQNLRLLKPVNYHYKDYINNSIQMQCGFVAQDIEHVFPNTLRIAADYIPNILDAAFYFIDPSYNKIIQFLDFDTNHLELDASGNFYSQIYLFDENDKKYSSITISKIISSRSIQIETDEKLTPNIFVYGQHIDNLKTLDYDRIFMTFASAMKEVDAQLQNEKLKTIEIERELHDLFASLQTNKG